MRFLFITPLASLSGWLCVQGAMDLYNPIVMEALVLSSAKLYFITTHALKQSLILLAKFLTEILNFIMPVYTHTHEQIKAKRILCN